MSLKPSIINIFGATGDLAKRKLIPALFSLYKKKIINEKFPVLAISRRDYSKEDYLEFLDFDEKAGSYKPEWDEFKKQIHYLKFDFKNPDTESLKNKITELNSYCNCAGNLISYLAISPGFFEVILPIIKDINIGGYQRVVFEKPFGFDLKSAKQLNEKTSMFEENQIYRIDHYLGKELVRNILTMRFANPVFGNIWNADYVDHVQITVSETVGVGSRGGYYDNSGALKDMLQNHLLQILALTAMDPPDSNDEKSLRDEKTKVLNAIREIKQEDIVLGQYGEGSIGDSKVPGYKNEGSVSDNSETETYVALKLFIDNERWKNIPFYIRTGKRLGVKSAEVNLVLKKPETNLFKDNIENHSPNCITIRIQPDEGINVSFLAKIPGPEYEFTEANLNFCHPCLFAINSWEAYELLIQEVLDGDQTLFARWDFIEKSWKIVDNLIEKTQRIPKTFPNYRAGSQGPKPANFLIKKDNRSWLSFLHY
jgi:glucose-6-phosphate 1-dehydrogenase